MDLNDSPKKECCGSFTRLFNDWVVVVDPDLEKFICDDCKDKLNRYFLRLEVEPDELPFFGLEVTPDEEENEQPCQYDDMDSNNEINFFWDR